MKNCLECKAELSSDAEFCHKCGNPVSSPPSQEAASGRSCRGQPDPELLAKSRAEHATLRADILSKARAKAGKAITFFLASCYVLAMFWAEDSGSNGFYYFLAFYGVVILTSIFMGRDRWLSQAEYYSITGSRDDNGEHRCLFCGNRGIYRHGEYAGNTQYAKCSKCQEPLFFH